MPTLLKRRLVFAWPEALVAICDLTILSAGFVLVVVWQDARADLEHVATWDLVLGLSWLIVAVNQGAYTRPHLREPVRSAYIAGKAMLIAGALFYLLPLVGGPTHARAHNIGLVAALAAMMSVWRLLVTVFVPSAFASCGLIVVGAGWAGQALAEAIARRPRSGWQIVAFVDDRLAAQRAVLGATPVHRVAELPELTAVANGGVRVVLANSGHARAAMIGQLTALAQAGVDVVHMWSLYEEITGQTPIRHLGHSPWAVLPRPSDGMVYRASKRILDVVLAVAGLAALFVVLPLLAPILLLQTGGSPFFSQWRAGRHGRPIRIFKLRTLPVRTTNPSAWQERKAANRPTRFAACVRATGLDELPQCWNVLRGEMSMVGPRPYMLEEAAALEEQIPYFRSRSLVRPGLTGWAQINYGYGLTLDDEVEKLQYDLFYIRQQSTYLDLLIVLRTLGILLRRRPKSARSLAAIRPRSRRTRLSLAA